MRLSRPTLVKTTGNEWAMGDKMSMYEKDEQRLKEIETELEKIRKIFDDVENRRDKQTGVIRGGHTFNREQLSEREFILGNERLTIIKRLKSA